jgi:hypothetical protein
MPVSKNGRRRRPEETQGFFAPPCILRKTGYIWPVAFSFEKISVIIHLLATKAQGVFGMWKEFKEFAFKGTWWIWRSA